MGKKTLEKPPPRTALASTGAIAAGFGRSAGSRYWCSEKSSHNGSAS